MSKWIPRPTRPEKLLNFRAKKGQKKKSFASLKVLNLGLTKNNKILTIQLDSVRYVLWNWEQFNNHVDVTDWANASSKWIPCFQKDLTHAQTNIHRTTPTGRYAWNVMLCCLTNNFIVVNIPNSRHTIMP